MFRDETPRRVIKWDERCGIALEIEMLFYEVVFATVAPCWIRAR